MEKRPFAILIVLVILGAILINNPPILQFSPQQNSIIGVGFSSPPAGEWLGSFGQAYNDGDSFPEGSLPTFVIERTAPDQDNEPSDPQFVLSVKSKIAIVYILIDQEANCISQNVLDIFPNRADWVASTKDGKVFDVYWNYLSGGEYPIPERYESCRDASPPRWNYIFLAEAWQGEEPRDPQPDPEPPASPPTGFPGESTPSVGQGPCGTLTYMGDRNSPYYNEIMGHFCSMGSCPPSPSGDPQICKVDEAKNWCGCEPIGYALLERVDDESPPNPPREGEETPEEMVGIAPAVHEERDDNPPLAPIN